MKVKHSLFILLTVLLSGGCKGPLSSPESSEVKPGVHKVVINDVLQAGEYTYLYVSEKRKKIWLAIPAMETSKGDKISFSGGLVMTNFRSKELNRTFPSVLFLEGVTREPEKGENSSVMSSPHPIQVKTEKMNISIEPGEGGISIAKLLEVKSEYSGKTVRVKGIITKFNPAILGKNWIHIQDGSEFGGAYDLTITTDSKVAVGDTVTFEGKIALKKDFGYGYNYDVIMEDARLVK